MQPQQCYYLTIYYENIHSTTIIFCEYWSDVCTKYCYLLTLFDIMFEYNIYTHTHTHLHTYIRLKCYQKLHFTWNRVEKYSYHLKWAKHLSYLTTQLGKFHSRARCFNETYETSLPYFRQTRGYLFLLYSNNKVESLAILKKNQKKSYSSVTLIFRRSKHLLSICIYRPTAFVCSIIGTIWTIRWKN